MVSYTIKNREKEKFLSSHWGLSLWLTLRVGGICMYQPMQSTPCRRWCYGLSFGSSLFNQLQRDSASKIYITQKYEAVIHWETHINDCYDAMSYGAKHLHTLCRSGGEESVAHGSGTGVALGLLPAPRTSSNHPDDLVMPGWPDSPPWFGFGLFPLEIYTFLHWCFSSCVHGLLAILSQQLYLWLKFCLPYLTLDYFPALPLPVGATNPWYAGSRSCWEKRL